MEDGNSAAELQRDIKERRRGLTLAQALRTDARIDEMLRPEAEAMIATESGMYRLFSEMEPDVISHVVAILARGVGIAGTLSAVEKMNAYLVDKAIDLLRIERGLDRLVRRVG